MSGNGIERCALCKYCDTDRKKVDEDNGVEFYRCKRWSQWVNPSSECDEFNVKAELIKDIRPELFELANVKRCP